MNIFHKVTLQGLKQNKGRTFVTIAGVVLSAALITAVFGLAVSLQNYMINGAVDKYGGWHIGFTDASLTFAQEQAEDKRVEEVLCAENIGYAPLEGGVNAHKPYLFISAFSPECFDALPVYLLAGRLPENSGEVIVPAHVASNGGVRFSVGDQISLSIGQRRMGEEILNQHDPYRTGEAGQERLEAVSEKTYTVVGLYRRPAFEERTAPGYTLLTAAEDDMDAPSLTAFVTLKNPSQLGAYRQDTQGADSMLNDNVLRFMGLSEDKLFNTLLYSAGSILVLLIMIGSIFMIYNAFHISLSERIHQFGILLSVGATERQLRNSVVFEGLCIGAAGIPVGIGVALPMVGLLLSFVERNFANVLYNNVSLRQVISPAVLVVAVAVSMATILLSAYIPARKALRTPIMECIRQTSEIKVEEKDVEISGLFERLCDLEGVLALKNFRRSKRRYRSVVLSLTFSVVLFVSCRAFGIYMQQEAAQSIVDLDYDISFSATGMEEKDFFMLYENMKNVDGVYESDWQTPGEATAAGEMTFCSHNPGRSVAQMQEILDGAGIASGYELRNYHEMLEQNRNMLFVVNVFAVIFSGMIALIAVANVFNTISTNIRLRRRELAMIRSIGMSDRDFNRMMTCECFLYGMETLLFSLPLSGIFCGLIYYGIAGARIGGEEGLTFTMPWGSIAAGFGGVFLLILITTLYTVSRIKRENIIDALRDDLA